MVEFPTTINAFYETVRKTENLLMNAWHSASKDNGVKNQNYEALDLVVILDNYHSGSREKSYIKYLRFRIQVIIL